jgi:hypothetical protein
VCAIGLSALPATTKQSPAIDVVSKVLEIIFYSLLQAIVEGNRFRTGSYLSASSLTYTHKMAKRLPKGPITPKHTRWYLWQEYPEVKTKARKKCFY